MDLKGSSFGSRFTTSVFNNNWDVCFKMVFYSLLLGLLSDMGWSDFNININIYIYTHTHGWFGLYGLL
jgi:hypothetical protein